MTEATQTSPKTKPILLVFMICFMGWASYEAFRDHKPLSSIAYISFAIAFLVDAIQIRGRSPLGKYLYYILFSVAVIFGVLSIFSRLRSA